MRRETQPVLETNGSSIREGLLSLRNWPVEDSSLPWLRIIAKLKDLLEEGRAILQDGRQVTL
jgi:hypothetical protein